MFRSLNRFAVLALSAGLFTVACDDDNVVPSQAELPTTYNFENVDHSGQLQRIQMLDSLVRKISTANDPAVTVTAAELEGIYRNSSGTLFGSSKQIYDKTNPADQNAYLEYFQMVENLSGNPANIKGGRLISPEGQEPAQLVAKGLMGSLLYWQAIGNTGYLGDAKMDVDNTSVTEGKGTDMQHHWDEAFGYFGAPHNYLETYGKDATTPETKAWFWAGYANKMAGLGVDVREDIFNAFIQGRDAIGRKDYATRDQAIATIREKWDLLVAASTLHYINSSLDDIAAGNSNALYHHWSEGIGFANALKYNPAKKISDSNFTKLLQLMRESPATASEDELNQFKQDLQSASLLLIEAYGFTPEQVTSL